jgi:hypothetical protein
MWASSRTANYKNPVILLVAHLWSYLLDFDVRLGARPREAYTCVYFVYICKDQ